MKTVESVVSYGLLCSACICSGMGWLVFGTKVEPGCGDESSPLKVALLYFYVFPFTGKLSVARSNAVKKIEELIKKGQDILLLIDKLMILFATTNPDFVTEYEKARIIVDLGRRHIEEEGGDNNDGQQETNDPAPTP